MIATTGKVLRDAYARPSSFITTLAVAITVILIAIILTNYSLLKFTIASGLFDTNAKIRILAANFGSFRANISILEQIIIVISAILAGINISVLAHYIKERVSINRAMGMSTVGIIGSFLGIGCASCGSVLLISILGLTSAGKFISFLPLKGAEFGIASILILLASLIIIARKVSSPLVCK